jgi:hypothetical protein
MHKKGASILGSVVIKENTRIATRKVVVYKSIKYREVEQLVARWAHNPKVAGSSPVLATTKKLKAA